MEFSGSLSSLEPAVIATALVGASGVMLIVAALVSLVMSRPPRPDAVVARLEAELAEERERRAAAEEAWDRAESARDLAETRAADRLAEAQAARECAEIRHRAAVDALSELLEIVDGDAAIWTRRPFVAPERYAERMAESIPVLAFANLKGGVGKTTLAANIAAWFDQQGERVLMIDLDHQGSLSSMALGGDPRGRDFAEPGARRILAGHWPRPIPLPDTASNSELIDAANVVQHDEMRILFRWMLGSAEDDVRYRLARLLLDPRIQSVYDRVVIDTPPRVTLGFVNALCAATHLLVPTQLNGLSIEAVQSFLATLDAMRPAPLPDSQRYRIVGVQKTWATDRLTRAEEEAVARIERLLANRGESAGLFLREAMVPQMSGFARAAGDGIAVRTEPSVRPEIARLGRSIAAFAPSWAEEPGP